MSTRYDAVIIGGGHNGLVHAAYLSRAGWRVLVLERRHLTGGAAVTEEVVPKFRFSVASYVVSLLRPQIIRELELHRHGLELLPLDGTFTPMPNGDYLWRTNDRQKTRSEIGRHSQRDADVYDDFGQSMVRMARAVQPLLDRTPPDPGSMNLRDIGRVISIANHLRRLARRDRYALSRLLTMSALDVVEQWFETDVLKATLAASGIIGTFLGIRSPGTGYVLLHHYMGELNGEVRAWGIPRGGTGAVSDAIRSAAVSAGAEVRTEAPVSRILLQGGEATGVVLETGEEILARVVSSSVDPHATFTRMVGEENLPSEFLSDLHHYRFRGSSGKVNLALDRLPEFRALKGRGPHLAGAISISPGTDYMERAYDDAKYGNFSHRPYIDIVIPSIADSSLAPSGKHVMSCFVQYAPYELHHGTWEERREDFGNVVLDTLAEYVPDIRELLVGMQVLTPLDLERTFGLTHGNIFQGELSLDQMFFLRPLPGWAQYRTPVRHLYMCGSATHPGGGIMGAPGRNAAREILRDHR